jgi:hypothetical protein
MSVVTPLPCVGIVTPPFTIVQVDIVLDADWRDPLPTIIEADGLPLNLTGYELQWYVRPTYDFDGEFIMLSTVAVGGAGPYIVVDDAAEGLASMAVGRTNLQGMFTAGEWQHFLLLKDNTSKYWELGRGPFRVHPGLTTAF